MAIIEILKATSKDSENRLLYSVNSIKKECHYLNCPQMWGYQLYISGKKQKSKFHYHHLRHSYWNIAFHEISFCSDPFPRWYWNFECLIVPLWIVWTPCYRIHCRLLKELVSRMENYRGTDCVLTEGAANMIKGIYI